MDQKVISAFTTWAFPGVLSFLMMMMYNDIKEMKTDVKILLEQSAVDKIKIEYLQKEIDELKNKSFAYEYPDEQPSRRQEPKKVPMYAIIPNNKDNADHRDYAYPTGV